MAEKIKVTVRGEEKSLEASITIAQLLTLENIERPEMVSVKLIRKGEASFLNRDQYDMTIEDQDEFDFVYFMGGGA